jgi:hypothetical protein
LKSSTSGADPTQPLGNPAMDDLYFSERVAGSRPCEEDGISGVFWRGLVAFVEARMRDGWFAERYPSHCFEAPLPVETDAGALGAALAAHNPSVHWPLDVDHTPDTLDILDAIEFFARIVSMPTARSYHDYGRHHHITAFSRQLGLTEFRREINTMLRRCGHPYEVDESGEVERLGPPILREALDSVVFASGDAELDRLLEVSRRKFRDPDIDGRREALEKLWDAWERLKTILPGDKRTSVQALLDSAVDESTLRDRIEREARELTEIGNTFTIRHWETSKVPIRNNHHIDYLFHRLFALILMVLRVRRDAGV